MSQIKSGDLKMKPRWHFVIGSLLLFIGLAVIFTGVIFLTNIIIFMTHRMGSINLWRLDVMISSIPLWIPILAITGVIVGVYLLKRYDFSYRKNFAHIVIIILLAILVASWSINQLGLNQTWSTRTPMRKFYEQLDKPTQHLTPGNSKRGAGSVRGTHKRGIVN